MADEVTLLQQRKDLTLGEPRPVVADDRGDQEA